MLYIGEMLQVSRDVPSWRTLRPLSPGTKVIKLKVLVSESHDIRSGFERQRLVQMINLFT